MSTGADWFRQRLGAPAPQQQGPAPVASPPGTVPYGYQGGPAPGQAYYRPPQPPPGQGFYQQPVQQGYQPQPMGMQGGAGITPQGYYPGQDEGLLQERPSSLLIAARSAQATGGSRKAQEHMRDCPECGKVMYATTRQWKGQTQHHEHCHNCGYQEGVRDGSVVGMAAAGRSGGGRVAPARQYQVESHPVTVVGDGVVAPKGQSITFQPNVRQ